jgi:Zn-dependent protease/CBS domain-containing protein
MFRDFFRHESYDEQTHTATMKWSFRIATIAGTEVRIHVTFFLLLAFVAAQGMSGGRGTAGAIDASLLLGAMFLCVLLHEFGHIFAARAYGIRTPDVTLLPIGGMARLERMPRKPLHEFVVAICGPLVNVVIAILIWVMMRVPAAFGVGFSFGEGGRFWADLAMWNVMMVVFNLIPAFPMDGGRILRALLAMFLEYGKATRLASMIGQGIAVFAVMWMLLGGYFNPFLILIAFFIFFAAGQEAAMVTQQEQTAGLRVKDAMITDFHMLPPDALLGEAVDRLISGSQSDFPVMDDRGGLLGLVTRTHLIRAIAEHGRGYPAKLAAETCEEVLRPGDSLAAGMERLAASPLPILPVLDPRNDSLVGLLSAENVAELIMVRQALGMRPVEQPA